jgi:hypothetical protein
VAETTAKIFLYCRGFDALVKRWDKCISVGGGYIEVPRFEYHMFYVLYPFVTYLLTLPSKWKLQSVRKSLCCVGLLFFKMSLSEVRLQLHVEFVG